MSGLRIRGLSPEPFCHLFGQPDDELARSRAIRARADGFSGYPERIALRDAAPGGQPAGGPGGRLFPRAFRQARLPCLPDRTGAMTKAGFRLDLESGLLAIPADDHRRLVYDPAVRGRTDRFILRFRRP